MAKKLTKSLLKLNLGCGRDMLPGWINIDIDERLKPDIVHDLYKPLPFAENTVKEIKAQDVLEHFTEQDTEKVISEISRVLIIGGIVRVRVPNVDNIFERFASTPETRNIFLYGNTAQNGIWGAHKTGFTKQVLVTKMKKHGLRLLHLSEVETNFEASFVKEKNLPQIKRITFICQTLDVGGAETFNADLLTELQRQGYSINCFVTNSRFADLLRQGQLPTQLIPVVLDLIGDWKGLIKAVYYLPQAIWYYWQLVKNNKNTDIILLSGFTEKIIVTPLARLFGVTVIWIEFGPLHPILNKFFQLPKVLYRSVKSLPEAVIVPSLHTKSDVIPVGRVRLDKVHLIPCGRQITTAELARFSNVRVKAQTVACVSRLEPGKGQDLLIQAFAKVIKKVPAAHLIITGESSWKNRLLQLVKQLKLEKSVVFVGRVPDALAVMAQSKVCVFPSVWDLEGFGLVMIESMALGKPIVAFKTGPIPEILFDGWNGLLAEKGNTDALAEKIILVLTNGQVANKIAKQAKIDFQRNYQISLIADQYADVFLTAVSAKQARVELRELHAVQ